MSQATPVPRSDGPDKPIAIASSPEMTPMPTVRLSQIRFSDKTVSYSSSRSPMLPMKRRTSLSKSSYASLGIPPTRQPCAKLSLKNFQNLFALAKCPEKNRDCSDVQRMRSQPKQIRRDAIQLSKDRANVMGPLWHGEPHHLLDRLNPDQSIRNGGDVIEPVPVRRDHRVHPILGDLLHAAMEIANVTIEINDRL